MPNYKLKELLRDSTNEPLPGANILEKGTSNGSSTDFNGNFTLTTSPNSTLIISFSVLKPKKFLLMEIQHLTLL